MCHEACPFDWHFLRMVIWPFTLREVFSSLYLHHVQCVISSVWQRSCRWILSFTSLPARHSRSAASRSYRSRFLAPIANQKAFSVIVHAMFSLTRTNHFMLFSTSVRSASVTVTMRPLPSKSDAWALELLLKLWGCCFAFMIRSFIPLFFFFFSFLLAFHTFCVYYSILSR